MAKLGIGEYRTRDGRKGKVDSYDPVWPEGRVNSHPWSGSVDGESGYSWTNEGRYFYSVDHGADIILADDPTDPMERIAAAFERIAAAAERQADACERQAGIIMPQSVDTTIED